MFSAAVVYYSSLNEPRDILKDGDIETPILVLLWFNQTVLYLISWYTLKIGGRWCPCCCLCCCIQEEGTEEETNRYATSCRMSSSSSSAAAGKTPRYNSASSACTLKVFLHLYSTVSIWLKRNSDSVLHWNHVVSCNVPYAVWM